MSGENRPPDSETDDEVVYIEDDGRDDVARAMAEAERAVAAVEERHKRSGEHRAEPADDAAERERREVRERAERAEEEAGRLREALLRKTADFENLKRRTEREKTDFFKFAMAETFRDLLPVVDNFERAIAHSDNAAGEDFRAGIEMIERQFAEALKKFGLQEIAAQGQPFDPNVHEAVVREETSKAAPGTVLEVLQKGYVLNDRLLRPALVKVAAAPTKPSGDA
ncbi:MAG: nucleotide exchange factor GrpE [Thermoanaerobaculia bacterium]